MITVEEALGKLFALTAPMSSEVVPLTQAHRRVLAGDVIAARNQPPFAASAMDGYAMAKSDAKAGAVLDVIGEAAAGHRYDGAVKSGQAVRIFTGAPLPQGADVVVIQENVTREGDQISLDTANPDQPHVRPAGADFAAGFTLRAPRPLSPADIALLASMNVADVTVSKRPTVAIIATGDELVQPGEAPAADQIIASNSYGLAALVENTGAQARLLPIARDTTGSLAQAFQWAKEADLIVTIGGASVGDHDLVGQVAHEQGMEQAFYKIAMRPGKPLMAGRMGKSTMVGLPGNPVSALVCGHLFIVPVIKKMLGLSNTAAQQKTARLAHDIGPNGPRAHYMRAHTGPDGVTIFERQDSALLTVLADANCLAIRPIRDPARKKGDLIGVIPI